LTVTSWRIVKKKYAGRAFDGEGARNNGGRWNSAGVPAIYTAGSVSLAILEMMVHAEPPLPGYVVIPVTFDSVLIRDVNAARLPAGWNAFPAPAAVIGMGDAWLRSRKSVVLRVPSALVVSESNYLLNPAHPDFPALVIGDPVELPLDPRLVKWGEKPG
jgi:RES domain-containing protein